MGKDNVREIHVRLDGETPKLLVPHEPMIIEDEAQHVPDKLTTWVRPKVCPACGAKFAHSIAMAQCTKCGVPDEILMAGPRMVARWQRSRGVPKHKQLKASKTKRRRKHGRAR